MIKVGIIGGAGYTAGELIRLLLHHPEAEIAFVHSTSNAKALLTDVHEGLLGETDMKFTNRMALKSIDVLFLCMGHGKSAEFLKEHPVPQNVRIIDLAQDFRLLPHPIMIMSMVCRKSIRRRLLKPSTLRTPVVSPLPSSWGFFPWPLTGCCTATSA